MVFGELPNMSAMPRSMGFSPLARSNTNWSSPVVSPTTYSGARSRWAIRSINGISSGFTTIPMRSWLSLPTISLADRVLSPMGSESRSMCPPVASTSSERAFRWPPAPWSWIDTIGFVSLSARALITLLTRFCISGLALCTALSSIAPAYRPVSTEDTAPPPMPIR